MSRHRAFAAAATLAVVLGIVIGFWNLGGPGKQREAAADQRRSEDLRRIWFAIQQFHSTERKLPPALTGLDIYSPGLRVQDPESNIPYLYQVTGETAYQLCATFNADTRNALDMDAPVTRFNYHPAARYCFNLDVTQPVANR